MDDAKRIAAADAGQHYNHHPGGRGGAWPGGRVASERAAQREQARALHRTLSWVELLLHPRVLLTVLPALVAVSFVFGEASVSRKDPEILVPAWLNPASGRWESPAPWDEAYRRLKPEVRKVARSLVHEPSAPGR